MLILLSCIAALSAVSGQYVAVRPVVYAQQPAVLRTVPVPAAPAVRAAAPVPTYEYVYQPSEDVKRILEATKKQSAYAAEKLASDLEAATNFKLEDAPGLDYKYAGPDYNNIAVQFGGSKYVDPATFTYQYKPEDQYVYDAENPKPFVYKYNGPTDFAVQNNENSYY